MINGLPHCLHLNFPQPCFQALFFVVVVVAVLFVFGGLHFDLILKGLTHAFLVFGTFVKTRLK